MTSLVGADGELTPLGRDLMVIFVAICTIGVALLCFLPQSFYPNPKQISTPGIVQYGNVYLLLTPFNSVVNGHQIQDLEDLFWIILQNVGNIFLLYPLVLGVLFLCGRWRGWKKALLGTFVMSLSIETSQLLLDLLIDAKRVVEFDDLWTNSLGGLLAYWTFLLWKNHCEKKSRAI